MSMPLMMSASDRHEERAQHHQRLPWGSARTPLQTYSGAGLVNNAVRLHLQYSRGYRGSLPGMAFVPLLQASAAPCWTQAQVKARRASTLSHQQHICSSTVPSACPAGETDMCSSTSHRSLMMWSAGLRSRCSCIIIRLPRMHLQIHQISSEMGHHVLSVGLPAVQDRRVHIRCSHSSRATETFTAPLHRLLASPSGAAACSRPCQGHGTITTPRACRPLASRAWTSLSQVRLSHQCFDSTGGHPSTSHPIAHQPANVLVSSPS